MKVLCFCRWSSRGTVKGRAITRRAARLLADDRDGQLALLTIWSTTGNAAAGRWVAAYVTPPKPTVTEEERRARTRAALEKRVRKREAHAREMLAKHERALEREKRAVARWRKKVARYDRRSS